MLLSNFRNLFNEMVFIFLWFWYVFLALMTVINFGRWLVRAFYWPGHIQYIRQQLQWHEATLDRETGILAKFAVNHLRRDGMFIVRLIGANLGDVVAGEILSHLWCSYRLERTDKPAARRRLGVGRSRTGERSQWEA